MNTNINHKGRRRFAPWTASVALALLAALVLVAPAVVFAQVTGQLSQECDFALIGNEHAITATVTEGGAPYTGKSVFFMSTEPYGQYIGVPEKFENGVATFSYTANTVAPVAITLYLVDSNTFAYITLDIITTNWTDNESDPGLLSCLDSGSERVLEGGQVTLNAKKRGALRIALCSVDGLDVTNVDLKTVQLAGVAPWRSHYQDSRLCPSGKDGVGDLVFTFKNQEVVEALENSRGELSDGDQFNLALTGSLKDGTSFEGEWLAVINKEDKRHKKEKHHQKKKCGEKKGKKDKLAKK
jgi:hypothetical protein